MKVAKRGGKVANDARISYEKEVAHYLTTSFPAIENL